MDAAGQLENYTVENLLEFPGIRMIRMKKKYRSLLLMLILIIMLGGCGNGKEPKQEDLMKEAGSAGIVGTQKGQTAAGLLFEVPEGFEEDEDVSGFYLSEDYQRDLACIFYQEYDTQERQELLTEDNIAPLMQEIYTELYGMDVVVEMIDFHKFRQDGYDGCRIETEMTMDDAVLQNIEYVIHTDEKSYSITFRQRKSAGWAETFAQTAGSLKVQ